MSYKIATSSDMEALEIICSALEKDGWKYQGGIGVAINGGIRLHERNEYYQAMVKEDMNDNKEG